MSSSRGRVARFVVLFVGAMLLACGDHGSTLPPEVLGTWTTSDAAYEGRYLKLGARTLELGVGGRDFELLPIRGVDAEDLEDSSTFYSVEYGQNADDALTLRFHFQPGAPEILRLEHQPQIWTRQKERPETGGISG